MLDYWASFVRTGVPSARHAPVWTEINRSGAYMHFTDAPHPASHLMDAQFQLHEQVVCRRHQADTQPWTANIGPGAPILPPKTEKC
jgi:para-nitrobenzyl esterase